jgi:hypothetical protein
MAETAPVFIPAESLCRHRRPTEVPIERKPPWLKVRSWYHAHAQVVEGAG